MSNESSNPSSNNSGGAEAPSSPAAPTIALPKGGGAIRGIGEKFAANPVTGTGSMSVPIAVSQGRSGFGPQLSLAYDSGAGNGPFGMGWSLALPSITRKTDKCLPQYLDVEESDVFLLSGAEDLVPVRAANGSRHEDRTTAPGYIIHRYRPRIEGLFARIERWTHQADGDVHWRSISKDNVLTIYGKDSNSRISEPADHTRIFSWLICETRDDKGNAVIYTYKEENGEGIDLSRVNERNRGDKNDPKRRTNRYLKRIHYGNRTSLLDVVGKRPRFLTNVQLNNANWMFEVVFDYDDGDYIDLPLDPAIPEAGQLRYVSCTPSETVNWKCRPDPFSTYRSGFEVRTTRLCQRVLMFHHFPGEAGVGDNCLVRSTDFIYTHEQDPLNAKNPVYSQMAQVTQSGYKRDGAKYLKRSLPPLEFEYTKPEVKDTVEDVDPASLENLPIGVDGTTYQWTDLHGEGIPGILTEQADAWLYKRNLSPRNDIAKVELSPLERVASKPNLALAGGAQFMDLAGDGQPDFVVMEGPTPGLYEHDDNEGWQPFRPFTSRLNRNTRDPNLKFIDLDGDGHADVFISEDDAFVWHTSLAEEGFGSALRVVKALDEEKGPRIVFADGTQSIYLSDISGDGLTDIVRIRNGEVCYWPNLGYGHFGAKVTMDNSPWFDNPDQFDHKRIRLADIDGSGTTDIIYLHRDGVRLYFNQSGNGWSKPQQLAVFPHIDDITSIVPADLLGNSTTCLVWSSALPGNARRPMRYVSLMGKDKPHLLVSTKNNLGAETRVHYVPSTRFYLKDKQAGKPWITRLPFPVHVVERVETWDHISKNRFVTRYAYHHGYFDGEEREFRGFGMVEQWDTEEIGALGAGIYANSTNWDEASFVPPIHTKTWFHTGVYLGRDRVSNFFAGLLNDRDTGEYYPPFRTGDAAADAAAKALLLDDTILPPVLSIEEEREACRALKGSMLRQEVYANDKTDKAKHPYTVTEQNFTIRMLQSRDSNRHGVFFTHPREALIYHYERNPADPRIHHALTLEVDDYGNVLKQAAIGYGRRASPLTTQWDRDRQTTPLLTYTENRVTNAVEATDDHRTPLPCEATTFELTGYPATGTTGRYQASDFVEPDPANAGRLRHKFTAEVTYEATATGSQCRRPVERLRTLYRRDDLTGLLPIGELQLFALPGESYKMVFTPGLLEQIYQRPRENQAPENLLPVTDRVTILGGTGGSQGGYVDLDNNGHWWIPSGRSFYHPNDVSASDELTEAKTHFFLPRRYRNPFGQNAIVTFDTANDLLITETRDALGNRVTVEENDYRVLQPRLVSDPNRNQTEVKFDTLGMVAGTAVMGKPLPAPVEGDSLSGFIADITQTQLDQFMNAPRQVDAVTGECVATQIVHDLLNETTTRIVYDLDRFMRLGEPPFAATISRETHVSDLQQNEKCKLQVSFSYSDGFGREIQKKIQAEKGKVPQREADGSIKVDADNQPVMSANDALRWVGSGWTVFNNKGKPVRQFEPFFSDTHKLDSDAKIGVSPVLFYDPAERVITTLHPNHTYEKVVFDPWQQTTYDVNDSCAPRNAQTGDPRSDPDIKAQVEKYFEAIPVDPLNPWKTWYQQRSAGDKGPQEQAAARKAADHADTPTTAHFDVLGRPFLTLARNRVVCTNHALDSTEDQFATRVELDIEGNQRAVRDERNLPVNGLPLGSLEQRIVMHYAYDMLGNRVYQLSMEAGARWSLNDVAGKPIRSWDSRGHDFVTAYDALRRPVGQYVRGTTDDSDQRTRKAIPLLVDKIEYGESLANAADLNLRTRIYLHFDSAGIATNAQLANNGEPTQAYDFKGNLLHATRQLIRDYKVLPDWSSAVVMEKDTAGKDKRYASHTTYDALNRPLTATSPDGSIYRPTFNEANLLDKVDVNLRGAALTTPFVVNIDYDAKGQRKLIEYGSGATAAQKGVTTTYDYDPYTFRLVQLTTKRPPNLNGLATQLFKNSVTIQDLHYTYDPAGNITHIADDALLTIHHNNEQIDPLCSYTYDALYRLIEATGREHIGQAAFLPNPPNGNFRDHPFVGANQLNNPQELRNYTEQYVYDAVGNFEFMAHQAANGNWTRAYIYDEDSLIEAGKKSNRLSKAPLQSDPPSATKEFGYDPHGNMTRMQHLPLMHWDYRNQLLATAQQVVNNGMPETTWYLYDAAGQRVRKVTESMVSAQDLSNGQLPVRLKERVYLGGLEIYREYEVDGDTPKLERESLHIMDDKQRIALVETKTVENSNPVNAPVPLQRYQFGNHLGSASLELAEDGALISYEEYRPYGTSAFQAGRSAAEVSLKRYRYTCKERDEENGLYYHGARYYAAWLGRWSSCDPLGLVDSLSLYCFVTDNPVIFHDSTGMEAEHRNAAKNPKPREQKKVSSASDQSEEKGFFEWISSGLQAAADWAHTHLPGLIAAPIAGILEIFSGVTELIGGTLAGSGSRVIEGAKTVGLGFLRVLGLRELFEGFALAGASEYQIPANLQKAQKDAHRRAEEIDGGAHGWHAWHAGSHAAIANILGPITVPIQWLYGIAHETPLDAKSFKEEEVNQGTKNHIIDAIGDIFANTLGIILGLLLPREAAVQAAIFLGNKIPGPRDLDPKFVGKRGNKKGNSKKEQSSGSGAEKQVEKTRKRKKNNR